MAKITDIFNTSKPENSDLSLKENDKILNAKLDAMLEESEVVSKEKQAGWKDNLDFFNGDQWLGKKQEFESDTTVNRIFPAIRNMVGLATDSRPKAEILAAPSNDPKQALANVEKAKIIGYNLDQRWQELNMQMKSTKTLFQAFIYDDAFWQPMWNYIENDVDVDLVNPTEVRIDPTAYGDNAVDKARYIIYRPRKNRKWIQDNYPEKLKEVVFGDSKKESNVFGKTDSSENDKQGQLKDSVQIDDFWTDEIRVLRAGKVILWKGPNPYFEFRSEEEQKQDWLAEGNTEENFQPVRNYFKRPRKPLIMINTYNIGELYSRSVMKQLKPLQVSLDKRKQQIDMNADLMANAQWIYDTGSMTEEEAAMLTNEPGLQIGVEDINKIRKEPGADMPQFIVRDIAHTEESFDNVMGHHDVSRGAKGSTMTATENQNLQEADQTPVRLLVRNYEGAVHELYGWWLQYMALFYTENHWVRAVGESGAQEFFSINQGDISDGVNIIIQPGSTLPKDKSTIKRQATEAAQLNLLDPVTYYEIMEFPDPKRSAQRLMNWQKGIISDEEQPPPPPQDNGPDERFISSMNYKDAPEDIRRQMEELAGLKPSATGGSSVQDQQDAQQQHEVGIKAADAQSQSQNQAQQQQAQQESQLTEAALDPTNPNIVMQDNPETPEDESTLTPDVAYAAQEEMLIAQGNPVEINPELVTKEHIDHHTVVLEDPNYPNVEALNEHTMQEIQLLTGGQQDENGEQPGQPEQVGEPPEQQPPLQ